MFFEEPRTDGLLWGPRNERKELMTALGDAPWNLETFLAFHLGVWRKKKPEPLALAPWRCCADFMHAFTVASGVGLATFRCLVELDTAESLEIVKAVLESGQGSNNQFEERVKILRDANELDILRNEEFTRLSKVRRNIINRVLAAEPGPTTT